IERDRRRPGRHHPALADQRRRRHRRAGPARRRRTARRTRRHRVPLGHAARARQGVRRGRPARSPRQGGQGLQDHARGDRGRPRPPRRQRRAAAGENGPRTGTGRGRRLGTRRGTLRPPPRATGARRGRYAFDRPDRRAAILARPPVDARHAPIGRPFASTGGPNAPAMAACPDPATVEGIRARRADMAVIEVEDLVKQYKGHRAVDGVSFTVEEGEIFGILGPNGAGKTTTVECVEGLRTPDSGRVSVMGLDPRRDGGEIKQILGAQLQESGLPDKIRVAEALDLYRSFYRSPADPEQLIELLGLGPKRNTAYAQLSGGQRQRLSIALALIGGPRVAVLDELTTGL